MFRDKPVFTREAVQSSVLKVSENMQNPIMKFDTLLTMIESNEIEIKKMISINNKKERISESQIFNLKFQLICKWSLLTISFQFKVLNDFRGWTYQIAQLAGSAIIVGSNSTEVRIPISALDEVKLYIIRNFRFIKLIRVFIGSCPCGK